MITPIFEITQESDFLIISIRVPYTRTSEFDLYIDGEDFKFYAKPYFLRLTLPGRIVEDGREKASFDVGKGIFTLRVPKETPGEPFEGLQMLTSLLAPKGSRSAKPLVEETELSGECVAESDDEDFDWEVDQEVQVEITEEELGGLYKYGFGNQRAGIFTRLQDELSDVIDVKSPDSTSAAERRQGRLAAETAKFEPDHYLADLFEDDAVQDVLKYRPWWVEVESKKKIKEEITQGHDGGEGAVFFSEEEKEQLRKFSNKSYLLDKKATHQVWISLVDIILAYVYEVRVTEGEKNTYNSVQEVLVSFGRRVLCYPLYRHFALIKAAIEDAAVIFELGKVCVLKCLLDIHKVFRENDPAYILNDLYITDYCVWIQKAKSKKVRALTEHLKKATLRKSDLELELDELETAAQLVKVEEEEEDSRQAARYRESIPESDSKEDSEEDDGSSSSSSSSAESDECSSDKEDSLDRLQSCFLEKASPPRAANIPEANPVTQHLDCEAGPRGEEEPLFVKLPGFPLSQPMPRKLIEELGDQVCSVVRLSEQPEGTDSRGCDVVQGERDKPSVQSAEHTVLRPATAETAASQGTFLEVCPQRNPLLIIADCDDDVEDS